MTYPKEKNHRAKKSKALRKLQRSMAEEDALIGKHLDKARQYAIEHDNGNAEATEDMRDSIADAIDAGLSPDAIRIGGGMVAKINALTGRPESQSHAAGLAYNLADLLADFDPVKAAEVLAIADGIQGATPEETERWRDIATPVKIVDRI